MVLGAGPRNPHNDGPPVNRQEPCFAVLDRVPAGRSDGTSDCAQILMMPILRRNAHVVESRRVHVGRQVEPPRRWPWAGPSLAPARSREYSRWPFDFEPDSEGRRMVKRMRAPVWSTSIVLVTRAGPPHSSRPRMRPSTNPSVWPARVDVIHVVSRCRLQVVADSHPRRPAARVNFARSGGT